tara:strand:+ start:834 stop:3764 length:2931 start_codon:yes stop_codon:yes gene_type:complete
MASVTQTIPTLTGGLSQQPDELKIPGQVSVANNVIPDVTHGLLKRPGGRLVASLSDNGTAALNSQTNGKWFSYYRDETESYVGQISRSGDINMWRCSDGAAMTVNYDSGTATALTNYLTHTDDEDIQTLTLNDFTFITNRTKTVSMSTTVEPVRPPEVFIDLRATAYARQYAVNLFDNTNTTAVSTATRISVDLVKSSNNYCHTDGSLRNRSQRTTDNTRCDDSAGDGRDAYAPNVGTRIFDIDDGVSLTDEALSGNHTYTIDVKDSSNNSVNRGTNLYFRIRTIGQSVPFTTGSGESQTTTYQARYTTTFDLLYGGTGWQQGDYFYVWMRDAYYKVTVEAISTSNIQANLGLIRPNPTPFDTETAVTAESIIGDIRTAIIGTGNFTSANVQQIGNGLYITRSSGTFNATAPSSDLLKVMSSEVKNVDDLPSQCKHGYVVKVANSEADADDYYVKFFGHNDRDGDGVWEECAKPGRNIEFDKGTMPIQLVRQANGTFTLSQATWENAEVGDDLTNPNPSFVDNKINQLVFFRNRLVFLSDENVIMSRPGEFFNFWSKTATTFTPLDVIDLSCSSEYPAIVYDGIQVNAGLLLFTKNQQFMLTTDSDILSPETAKLNAVSSYNFNEKTNPVSLGTTVAFLDNANQFTRFFEMSNVVRQGEPDVLDQSKVISRLLAKDISIVSVSRENSVVFFSQKNSDTIYCFRYFTSGDTRLLQAWTTWTVTGNIQYHCMLDDALVVITRNNNKDQMIKYSLKLDDDGHFVTDTKDTASTDDDVIYRVHLDHSKSVTAAANTYNATTIKTTIPKPNGFESTKQLVAYDTDAGNDLGRYALITVNGSNLEIAGDWSNNTFVIGYLFEMDVQIPTLYTTQKVGDKYRSDNKASLVIHRIKFSFGPLGVYSTTIQRGGKPDFTETKELGLAGFVGANRLPIVSEVVETVPCYERNTNLKVNVKSEHPAPATLYSLAWEGDYTNRFYRRV